MSAAAFEIELEQNADYSTVVTYQQNGAPVNLTGYSCQFKAQTASGTVIDWSSYVTLGGAAGTVTILIPGAQTATYTGNNVPVQYDLMLTSGAGAKTRLIRGTVAISPGISS